MRYAYSRAADPAIHGESVKSPPQVEVITAVQKSILRDQVFLLRKDAHHPRDGTDPERAESRSLPRPVDRLRTTHTLFAFVPKYFIRINKLPFRKSCRIDLVSSGDIYYTYPKTLPGWPSSRTGSCGSDHAENPFC